MKFQLSLAATLIVSATAALADGHATPTVEASDQDVSNGVISASTVVAGETGWLVVHKTDGETPGPVVGHAPLRAGENTDVAAILTEPASAGDQFMLMIHSEAEGNAPGIFEYTLGAKEDGPIRIDGALVMALVTAK